MGGKAQSEGCADAEREETPGRREVRKRKKKRRRREKEKTRQVGHRWGGGRKARQRKEEKLLPCRFFLFLSLSLLGGNLLLASVVLAM